MTCIPACVGALATVVLISPVVVAAQKTATPPKALLSITYQTLQKKKSRQYDIRVTYPVFAGSSDIARLANRSLRAYAVNTMATFVSEAEADYSKYGAESPSNGSFLVIQPQVSLARPDLVSVYFDQDTYNGGPHPNTEYFAQSFGIVQGKAKQLVLTDLVRPGQDPYDALSRVALPKLKQRNASSVVGEDGIKKLDSKKLRTWCVTPSGITLLFAPYEVGAYAEGPFIVKIAYPEIQDALNPSGPLRGVLSESAPSRPAGD